MRINRTRFIPFVMAPLALCGSLAIAAAGECPGNPDALGTSRTIVVDPREHGRIGAMNYSETLPLVDKEVVITFDDGPLPPYTNKILDILASECVHATYFMVGDMARAFPDMVRRVHAAGHTIGTHSMTHPIPFGTLGLERSAAQIEDGIKAIAAALGDPDNLAPFFRFPGLARTDAVEDYLGTRGLMVWSADFPADDWRRISAGEIVRRAMRRLEAMGRGVLLLHDIHPATVLALPTILEELKARGYRIVHVVPASKDRPKTVTLADAWRVHPRARLPFPMLAIAEVQNPDGESLMDKSVAELCGHKIAVAARPAQPPHKRIVLTRHRHRPAKIAKVAQVARIAQASAAPVAMPDIHAIPQ